MLNENEITILKGLLNLKIRGFTCVRSSIDLKAPTKLDSFGPMEISFDHPEVRHNRIHVGIDPMYSGEYGNKFIYLTQWIYVYKPLAISRYFPQQDIDSKYTSNFDCSFLGVVNKIALYAHFGNSGFLRLDFEFGSVNLILGNQMVHIDFDNSQSISDIQRDYFESQEGVELLNISAM